MTKEILSAIAILLTLYAFYPYLRSILKGETKPHVFSWVIWGITTLIVFLAQLADRGGAGAWPTGISGIITLAVATLAHFKRADDSITKTDWTLFLIALLSVPVWYLTTDPLWAVVLLTGIDVLGFGPTFRKSYDAPYSENLGFYVLIAVRNVIAIIALEHYSLTTILFPAVMTIACLVFIRMIIYRRRLPKKTAQANFEN